MEHIKLERMDWLREENKNNIRFVKFPIFISGLVSGL